MQLVEHVKMDILSGRYEPGDKISAVRELAQEAAVNPNTMQRALAELERIGLVYAERTSGRYVTKDLDFIQKLKKEQAEIVTREFITKLNQIGYEKDTILELVRESIGKE